MARGETPAVDIRRLRHFVAVCEHGGLSRAAQAIGIAQPALTRQIKLLEHELGIELFTRNGRGAIANDAGRFLLEAARRHLHELDDVVDRLRTDFGAGPVRVNLGICPTIVPLFLDQVGDYLRQAAGSAELSVIEAYSGDLRSLMDAGELDLALTYSPAAAPQHVTATRLLSERLVVAAQSAPDRSSVSLDELGTMRLILPSRIHQLRQIIDAACAARRLALTPTLELDSLETVKALVADGTGTFATILPFHSVAEDAAGGRFETRLIDEPGMVRTIALLQPAEPRSHVPDGLAERIIARAEDIKRTLEAVY